MSKQMVVLGAVLTTTGTMFGAWSANKFGTFDPNNIAPDRTVDWESDGNSIQRKGESWNWPATYDFVPICDVRVQMDVGFWIKIVGCKDSILKLKQRMINQYGGQTTCTAYSNVATEWKAEFKKKDSVNLGGYSWAAAVDPTTFPAKPNGQSLTVKLKLWDVDLANLPAGMTAFEIGVLRVSVRPTVRPNNFMSGGSQSFPVYAPPPVLNNGQGGLTWW